MLLEYSVSNFFSFHDKMSISMTSGVKRAKVFAQNTIYTFYENRKKQTVLNAGMILGPNASGKTNLIKSIEYLKHLTMGSYMDRFNFEPTPFAFTDRRGEEPTTFQIVFVQELDTCNYEFEYIISQDSEGNIEEESLTRARHLKVGKEAKEIIFRRTGETIKDYHSDLLGLVEKYEKEKIHQSSLISLFVNDINRSYYKRLIDTHGYQCIQTTYRFIVEKITLGRKKHNIRKISRTLMNDTKLKEKILLALNEVDNSIEDFEIEETTAQQLQMLEDELVEASNDEVAVIEDMINRLKITKRYSIRTIHSVAGGNYLLDYDAESDGTKRFIQEFIDIVDALENDKVYIVDELDDHYHELVQNYVLGLFLNQEEEHKAQIIFTTHNTDLLNPKLFAKEQVWFMEKCRKKQTSEIYRLSEFEEVTYDNHSWKNLYLQGRLGATPKVMK